MRGGGSRRITADALGPRTVQKVLVTMGPQHALPVRGIRPVAAIAPGVSGSTGLTLCQLAGAMVEAVRPAALICVEGADLVVTPRALDSVIAHGSALLAAAINRALQPRLSVAQLCWLTG